jgi:hypothetical protein
VCGDDAVLGREYFQRHQRDEDLDPEALGTKHRREGEERREKEKERTRKAKRAAAAAAEKEELGAETDSGLDCEEIASGSAERQRGAARGNWCPQCCRQSCAAPKKCADDITAKTAKVAEVVPPTASLKREIRSGTALSNKNADWGGDSYATALHKTVFDAWRALPDAPEEQEGGASHGASCGAAAGHSGNRSCALCGNPEKRYAQKRAPAAWAEVALPPAGNGAQDSGADADVAGAGFGCYGVGVASTRIFLPTKWGQK